MNWRPPQLATTVESSTKPKRKQALQPQLVHSGPLVMWFQVQLLGMGATLLLCRLVQAGPLIMWFRTQSQLLGIRATLLQCRLVRAGPLIMWFHIQSQLLGLRATVLWIRLVHMGPLVMCQQELKPMTNLMLPQSGLLARSADSPCCIRPCGNGGRATTA